MAAARLALLGLAVASVIAAQGSAHRAIGNRVRCMNSESTIYDDDHRFVTLQNQTEVALSEFRGKVAT